MNCIAAVNVVFCKIKQKLEQSIKEKNHLWGFSTFFLNRSMVKSFNRNKVGSEIANSCNLGVCGSSSSNHRAHLGVTGFGGSPGLLNDWGRLIWGIGGSSEDQSDPARPFFRPISDKPKSESCGVRSTSETGGGSPMRGDVGWMPSASSTSSSPHLSSPAVFSSFSSAALSAVANSWQFLPVWEKGYKHRTVTSLTTAVMTVTIK